jgi:hypothetical protein
MPLFFKQAMEFLVEPDPFTGDTKGVEALSPGLPDSERATPGTKAIQPITFARSAASEASISFRWINQGIRLLVKSFANTTLARQFIILITFLFRAWRGILAIPKVSALTYANICSTPSNGLRSGCKWATGPMRTICYTGTNEGAKNKE